jgi:hypothetical protein
MSPERPLVRFVSLGSKVYDGCFVCLKSRSAPFLPVECVIDNCFDTFPITLRRWSRHPRCKIVHERDCSALAVDLSLYEVCVKEEEQDRGQRRTLRQSSLWQALDLRQLPIDLYGRRSFRAERLNPPEQILRYTSRFHPLKQSFFAHSIIGSFDIKAHQAQYPSATPRRVDLLL